MNPQLIVQGKPVARRGRKARGLAMDGEMAQPPISANNMEVVPEMSQTVAVPPVRRRIRWSVPAALATLAAAAVAAVPAADARVTVLHGANGAHTVRTDSTLDGLAARHPGKQVEVIVQFDDGINRPTGRATVRAVRGKVGQALPIINGLSARMRADTAVRLARRSGVRAVTLNGRVHSTAKKTVVQTSPLAWRLNTTFNQTIGADRLWNQATGTGVGVAVIDTGVAGDHADFRTSSSDASSRVIASVVTNPDAKTAADTFGHGTHVAGLVAGNGSARSTSDNLYGRYSGSAPEANVIAIKAADDEGNATVIDVLWGIQFVLEHQDELGIRVINLSVQSGTPVSYQDDPLDAAVEVAWMRGLVVVAAAGNLGSASDAVSYSPGNDPFVITVGATDEHGTSLVGDDTVASFSSRGSTQDGFSKPEVYAPGSRIVSTLAPNSAFTSMCPTCILDGEYIRASGTSMSAPIVAGAAADLLQLHPEWTPNQVKGALVNSLQRSADGVGVINVATASTLSGAKLNANGGLRPSRLAEWINDTINQWTTVNADGTSTTDWSRSSWSKRSSWSAAVGDLAAGFARSSWSCACDDTGLGMISGTRSSWGRSSWSSVLEQ
jgi:serine protease AprX